VATSTLTAVNRYTIAWKEISFSAFKNYEPLKRHFKNAIKAAILFQKLAKLSGWTGHIAWTGPGNTVAEVVVQTCSQT
jgi:hypothetical protein